MKIGEFSKKYNLSSDTIRYYINLGLIFPKKLGKQNIFSLENEIELKNILELKKNCFSLQDIKEIIYFEKLVKNPEKKDLLRYNDIFNRKVLEISKEIEQLEEAKRSLNKKLNLKPSYSAHKKRGVPIDGIDLLQCPKCSGKFNLSATFIENSEILEGLFSCNCGKQLRINEGIIFDDDFIDWNDDWMKYKFDKNYYLEVTPNSHIQAVFQTKKVIDNLLSSKMLIKKRILTLRCGGLDHFSSLLNHIDDNIVHFFMDVPFGFPYFKHVKDEFDKLNLDKKIIFFVGDYKELPLKNNSFNLLFDLLTTTNYNNYDYSLVSKFLTAQNEHVGLYLTSELLEKKYPRFNPLKLKNDFIQQGYKIEFEFLGDEDLDGGILNPAITETNKTRNLVLYGKK